jgi:hypothetical protein
MKTIWKFIAGFYAWQSKQPPFMYLLCLPFHVITITYGICWVAYNAPKFIILTIIGYWWCHDCETRHHYWGKGHLDGKPLHFWDNNDLCMKCYDKQSEDHNRFVRSITDEIEEIVEKKAMKKTSLFDTDHAQVKAQHHKEDQFDQQGGS